MEDNGLEEFIDKDIPKLVDIQDLAEWKKCGKGEKDYPRRSSRSYYLELPR